MQGRHEQVIYENDKNQKAIFKHSFPFFLNFITGTDGTSAIIAKTKGTDQDGSAITNVTLSDRQIAINGSIMGETKEEVAAKRNELLKLFNPRVQGWLQYEYGNVKKKIRCQVEDAPVFSKRTRSFKYQDFIIFLTAQNPYWQDINETISELALWKGLFSFPLEFKTEGIEMGLREPSLIKEINNKGDVACGIKIIFKAIASVQNPSILDVNTREFFKLNKTLEAGEKVTVTTHFRNKRVTLEKDGVSSNAFNWIDLESSFLQLEPGKNLYRYDAENGIDNLSIDIFYTPQYLGV